MYCLVEENTNVMINNLVFLTPEEANYHLLVLDTTWEMKFELFKYKHKGSNRVIEIKNFNDTIDDIFPYALPQMKT